MEVIRNKRKQIVQNISNEMLQVFKGAKNEH